jgi:hypothetical protein
MRLSIRSPMFASSDVRLKISARDQSGFSLPTILCLGVCAALILGATAEVTTKSMARISGERLTDVMRSSAESGLDWSIEQLSDTSTRQSIDTGSPVAIPPIYLNSLPGANVTGTVTVVRQEAPKGSYLYSSLLDSQNTQSATNGLVEWRMVTAHVTNGTRSKSVRVILKPIYSPTTVVTTSTTSSTSTSSYQPPPKPIFTKTLAAPGSIVFNGQNSITNSYDSAIATSPSTFHTGTSGFGDVSSNTLVDVGNGDINGAVTVTAGQGSGSVSVASGGDVTKGVQTSGTSNFGNTTLLTGDAAAKQYFPDVPSAPATAKNLGVISGNYTIAQPGDYIVSSIAITGSNGALNLPATGVVNIYVQGAGASISIGGQGIQNPSGYPANVRIWYSGSNATTISGNGSMKAVVYAPNSAVEFKGNGEFYGAAVGQSVKVTGNGVFHYDEALGRSTELDYVPPVVTVATTYNTSSSTSINYNFSKYQTVSWMEF